MKEDTLEQERLEAIQLFDILDRPPEKTFDRITAMAARMLNMPISVISMVDSARIWFVSHHGIDVQEIAKHPGFCATAILTHEPYIVNDAELDPRTCSNPLVEGGVRFYAGVPLTTRDGRNIGAISVIDTTPRFDFCPESIMLLQDLAAIVVDELERRMEMKRVIELESELLKSALEAKARAEYIANHDHLTGLVNRMKFMSVLEDELASFSSPETAAAVFMLDLDKFKNANDTFGHQMGDEILKEVAHRIRLCVSEEDVPARLGGDEFIIIKRDSTRESIQRTAENLVELLAKPYSHDGNVAYLSASIGIAICRGPRDTARQLIRNADLALYTAKSEGGKRYEFYSPAINPVMKTRQRS